MEGKIFQRNQYFTLEIFDFTRKTFWPTLNITTKIPAQLYFQHDLCPFTPRGKTSLCQHPTLRWRWHGEKREHPSSQLLQSGRSGNVPHIPQTLATHPSWLCQSHGICHVILENNAKTHLHFTLRSYSCFSKISGSSWTAKLNHY